MAEAAWVGLADAIQQLRRELVTAMVAGVNEPLRFELTEVEVEFAVTLRRDGEGSLGVNFGVVSAGGRAGVTSDSLHRLTVRMRAKDWLTDEDAYIAGQVDQMPQR